MADEKIGITVEVKGTGAGIKSVKELKDEVKKLDETINKSDFGSEEYKKATAESEKLRAKMEEISGKEVNKMTTSLKALQQEYKKLKVALSEAANPEEFTRLSKELNDVEGKIGDINDAANIATGSGIEQLNKGIGLIGEGFRNFDFEKIKIGFKGIGNAMSAIAPLALIAAIGFLIENFDQLVFWSKKITGSFSEQELRVQSLTRALEVQTAATIKVNKEATRRVELLTAEGGKEIEILAIKKQAIESSILQAKIDGQLALAKRELARSQDDSTEALVRTNIENLKLLGLNDKAKEQEKILSALKKERTKEETKTFESSIQNILDLENSIKVLDQNEKNRIEKTNKEKSEANKKANDDELRKIREANELKEQAIKQHSVNSVNLFQEEKNAKLKAEQDAADAEYAILVKKLADKKIADDKAADEEKKRKELIEKGKKELEVQSFNAAKNLSDAIFAIQIGNAKKGSAEETKLKKQQFNINKAFAVTQATIDGVRAVQTVIATYPTPISIPIAIATGISSAANIAKIASAKFDGGASGGGSVGAAPQIGSTNLPTPPTINTPQNNTNTSFDSQGNNSGINEQRTSQQNIKVFVTENDISEVQKRANKLKTQTTI